VESFGLIPANISLTIRIVDISLLLPRFIPTVTIHGLLLNPHLHPPLRRDLLLETTLTG